MNKRRQVRDDKAASEPSCLRLTLDLGYRVYHELAAQSNLERLICGHFLEPELNDPLLKLDCLDLELVSGMDELPGPVKTSVMSLGLEFE